MAELWSQPSNTSLGTFEENITLALDLPLIDNTSTVTLVSGKLPGGLRLSGTQIIGTPYEVPREIEFRFVLRATLNNSVRDRTFKITITGADVPVWTTTEGLLPIGSNNTYYILDSSPVDYQLLATDEDLEAGQTLEYFIASGDGELPPGISLTADGRLVGVVDPILAIERQLLYSAGTYDTAPFDLISGGYDFGERSSNGFDSFYYDDTVFDFNFTERTPKKLNRYYQFRVTVSDGDLIAKRLFRIYVVGDDFLRADNTIMNVGTGTFTADNTNIRVPIWLTPADLGVKRANNYVTLFLDIIDPNSLTGIVTYDVVTNPGTYTFEDGITAQGRWEITKEFPRHPDNGIQIPVNASKLITGEKYVIVRVGSTDFTQFGATQNFIGHIFTATSKALVQNDIGSGTVRRIDFTTVSPETESILPPGTELDGSIGEIAGRVPYQAEVTTSFTFTIRANRFTPDQAEEEAFTDKTFTIRLLGEINSETKWITDNDLGIVTSNAISVLKVEAETNVPSGNLIYSVTEGRLPPGLELTFNGEIVGKVNAFGEYIYKSTWRPSRQYQLNDIVKYDGKLYKSLSVHQSTSSGIFTADAALWADYAYPRPGLTVFDSDTFRLDGNTTTVDREYIFTVLAQDQFKYSLIKKEFKIKVTDPDSKRYSNIFMKPFLKENIRANFFNFISDPEIFIPEHIYRPNDPNFGIQREIKMLLYPGIETKEIENFVALTSKNHKKKRYRVGDLKTAIAKVPGTDNEVYEVLYLDVIDPSEPTSGRTKVSYNIKNTKKIKVNSVKATPKDMFYDWPEKPSFVVPSRSKSIVVTLGEEFELVTRDDGIFDLLWQDNIEVDTRVNTHILEILQGLGPVNMLRPTPENVITIDNTAIKSSQTQDNIRYISNITNMRDAIKTVGVTERNFVPLWMRTSQGTNVNELGYTPALVLCYTKPGKAAIIKSAIEANGFNFKQFDLEMDRYIIDSTLTSSQEKYILFANYQYNV